VIYVGFAVALSVPTENERGAIRSRASAVLLRLGFDRREPALGEVNVRRERARYER